MRTKDNNGGKNINELKFQNEEYNISDLEKMANHKIRDINFEKSGNLLIFPPNYSIYGDNIGEETIFSLYNNNGTCLKTNNIMGFAGINKTKITITSRFSGDDENDYFLHYMLQKVLSINILKMDQSGKNESIWNFLPYLFPYYLKRAVSQGIYRSYRTFKNNNSNIKGIVDIKRHLLRNIPFSGNIAYEYREYNTDNEITQLVRHVIEEITADKRMSSVLNSDNNINEAVRQIISATSSYNRKDRNKIIMKNMKPVKHPYYNKYRELQKLCLMLLQRNKISFGNDKNRLFGLLFNGAWLWEEYLGKLLRKDFIHPRNITRENMDFMFVDNKGKNIQQIYPDFKSKNEPYIIADAKYKYLYKNENEYGRNDFFQILAYMFRYSSQSGYLLFPYDQDTNGEIYEKEYSVISTKSKLTILGLPVPQNSRNFLEFVKNIKKAEVNFLNKIMIN